MIKKQHFIYTEGGGFKFTPQVAAHPEAIEFIIIDLFCGAGGVTTGFSNAEIDGKKIAIIAACVNHDHLAIKSHWINHPEVVHFEEDIRTLKLSGLFDIVQKYRLLYPNAKVILWGSMECINFSKAKGGQPRDADSRTLAENLYMHYDPETKTYYKGDSYIQILDPDYIMIENVVEFMSWGPLDDKGKPLSKKNGQDFMRWKSDICELGYHDQWREMNSADFGAYTSRNRLFGCFAKHGLPIVFPEPTHAKKPVDSGFFGPSLQKWKAVKHVLDFEDEGVSIFTRKKPLSPKTLERVYAGCIKYVAGGKKDFMIRYNSVSSKGSYKQTATDTDNPCPTISTQNRLGLCFLAKYYSGKPEGKVIPVSGPAGTITCVDSQSLVQPIPFRGPAFIAKHYSTGENISSIEEPAGTVTTKDRFCKVQTVFLDKGYSGPHNHQSVAQPSGTLTTKDHYSLVWLDKTYSGKDNHQSIDQPAGTIMVNDKHQQVTCKPVEWLDRNFTNGGQHSSIDDPAGSILSVPKLNKVTAQPFIMDSNYNNVGKSVNGPCPPLLASRRHHYIVNPSHGGHSTSTDAPCPVIVARQDKAPLYLTQAIPGLIDVDFDNFFTELDIILMNEMFEDEQINGPQIEKSVRVRIIEFMLMYGIGDIKMRMLKVSELKLIQGFDKDYVLEGNQTHQKKFIGNSVVPIMTEKWSMAMAERLRENELQLT